MIYFPVEAVAEPEVVIGAPYIAAVDAQSAFSEILQKITSSEKLKKPETVKLNSGDEDKIDLLLNENVLEELAVIFAIPPPVLEKIADEIKQEHAEGAFSLPSKTNNFNRDYVKPLAIILTRKISKITDIEFNKAADKISEIIKKEFQLKELEKTETETNPEPNTNRDASLEKTKTRNLKPADDKTFPPAGEIKKESPAVVLSKTKTPPPKAKDILRQITSQITTQLKFTLGANKNFVRIALKPENLGEVSLKIQTSGGEVKAVFTAQNESVKAIIESGFKELKDSLAERGLFASQLSAEVDTGEKRFFQNFDKQMLKQDKKLNLKEVKDYKNYLEILEDSIINFIA